MRVVVPAAMHDLLRKCFDSGNEAASDVVFAMKQVVQEIAAQMLPEVDVITKDSQLVIVPQQRMGAEQKQQPALQDFNQPLPAGASSIMGGTRCSIIRSNLGLALHYNGHTTEAI